MMLTLLLCMGTERVVSGKTVPGGALLPERTAVCRMPVVPEERVSCASMPHCFADYTPCRARLTVDAETPKMSAICAWV